MTGRYIMTQTTEGYLSRGQDNLSIQSSLPLPGEFSSALVEMFNTVQPSIVQVGIQERGGGTGVIWNPDGRIITNAHVVANEQAKIHVHLTDGRTLEAKVLHRDPRLDLAMLKVNGDNLKALPIGDSSRLRIGEWVFAIGHPWGQRWALTAGIVSSLSSVKVADDLTTRYIKSDVGLAPGNSGGPLLDAEGKVVGVNAMIFGGDLSVAIPSDIVSIWLAGLPASKRQVTLGIEIQQVELPPDIRNGSKPQRETGLLIVGIAADRQAKYSDLLIGDILLDLDGKPVNNGATLRKLLAESEGREAVSMNILRGGVVVTVDVATRTVEQAA
ncbi:MAG: trypsin-like serine protease [Chloroflexi bacterium]|nr:MAG: trypsin-like serine protease [Chloroflexota bacterium]